MAKQKLDFNADDAVRSIKKMEKEAEALLENAKGLRILTDAKRVTEGLESVNGKLKREIDKNNKLLENKEEELRSIENTINVEFELVETKKSESKERIKEITKNEGKRIKEVQDNSKKVMEESQEEARVVVKANKKVIRDSNQEKEEAITDRDKAVQAYNSFTEKFAGAK